MTETIERRQGRFSKRPKLAPVAAPMTNAASVPTPAGDTSATATRAESAPGHVVAPHPAGAESPVLTHLRRGYIAGMQQGIASIPDLRAAIGGEIAAQLALAREEAEAIRRAQSFAHTFSAVDTALSPGEMLELETFASTCGRWDATSPQVALAAGLVDRKLRQRGARSGESDPEDENAPTLNLARSTVSSQHIDIGLWNEACRLLHANRIKQLLDLASILEQFHGGDPDDGRRRPTHRAGDSVPPTLHYADPVPARRA